MSCATPHPLPHPHPPLVPSGSYFSLSHSHTFTCVAASPPSSTPWLRGSEPHPATANCRGRSFEKLGNPFQLPLQHRAMPLILLIHRRGSRSSMSAATKPTRATRGEGRCRFCYQIQSVRTFTRLNSAHPSQAPARPTSLMSATLKPSEPHAATAGAALVKEMMQSIRTITRLNSAHPSR